MNVREERPIIISQIWKPILGLFILLRFILKFTSFLVNKNQFSPEIMNW